jgi:hypothetical protein
MFEAVKHQGLELVAEFGALGLAGHPAVVRA